MAGQIRAAVTFTNNLDGMVANILLGAVKGQNLAGERLLALSAAEAPLDSGGGGTLIASGTVVPHPAADFCKAIFDSGVALLTSTGVAERNARSLIGRLRQKLNDDPSMLVILRQAETEQPSDPAAWLTAAVETRNGTRTPIRSQPGKSSRAARAAEALRDAAAEQADFGDYPPSGCAFPA